MSARYYKGTSLFGQHPVAASTERSFRDVVDTFRICPQLGVTRAAFLAMPKDKRDEVKRVPYFVSACFKSSPSPRRLENATHCNLIFLDVDELPDGRCPAAPFVNDPENLFTALEGFSFAAYTTATSTKEKPRMRVVVDAKEIPLSSYIRAMATIAAMLGLSGELPKENKVAVQPMFLPTQFSDSTEDEHPLIAWCTDGAAFTVDNISDSLFPEFNETKRPTDYGADALDFLRAPVPEITIAIAKDALEHIDADCSYYEWINVGMALRHQFNHTKPEEAFHLFDEWSSKGTKYGGEEETQKKWNSIKSTPVGRVPITIGTLLKQAVAGGWDDGKVKENCFQKLVQWMDEVGSITELMEKGVKRILAMPLLSTTQESLLVSHLSKTAKLRFAHTIPVTDIKQDLKRVKAEVKAQEKPADKVRDPIWAKGVCYVAATKQFFRHRTGEKYDATSFDAIYARHLLPTEDQLRESGKPVTPAALATPIVPPSDYVLNHLKFPTVYDFAYDPSQPNEVFFVHEGRKYVNMYSPSYPEHDPKNEERAGGLLQLHLSNLIGEPEYRRVFTDYLAHMVQFPGKKIRWAPLFQSVEGAGKTFFSKLMQGVLGKRNVKTVSDTTIRTGYNEWAFGYQLVVLEEVRVVGTNRNEIMNALKPLITNDDIPINQKFRDSRDSDNISCYMAFTNFQDALALTPGDRRWFVVKSPLQNKHQVLALGEKYFKTLFNAVRDWPGAFRAYLDNWEISPDFDPDGHAPRTKYVQEMVNDTAGELHAAVRELLLEGDYSLIQYDIVSSKALMDVLTLEQGQTRVTPQKLAQVLREEGFTKAGDKHLIGEEKHALWCRAGVDLETAGEVARARLKEGAKNLCMDLLFP